MYSRPFMSTAADLPQAVEATTCTAYLQTDGVGMGLRSMWDKRRGRAGGLSKRAGPLPVSSATLLHLLHLFLYLFLHLFLPPCLHVAVTVSLLRKRPSSVSPVQVQMMHRRSAVPWVWCLKNSQGGGHQMPLCNKHHRNGNPNQTKAGW